MSEELRRGADDPASARNDIEQTRQRMSGTLDQIEGVILRKKEHLEEKKAEIKRQLDVGARIREQPLMAAGVVLGAGFLIGFLTGGGGRKAVRSATRRGAKWEKRARRLLEIAQTQEEEIEALRAGYADAPDPDEEFLSEVDDPDYAYLSGEELYPLDPEFDDDTIEYRPARASRCRSWRDRVYEFAADTVDSVLDSVQARR
jgi:ElaB/YqjD/DUF883 family membrane-anchored ribosome-binding protein